MPQKNSSNREDDIRPINPMDHVRLRPGMYFGGTGKDALQHLVHEVLDNAVEEAMNGYCSHISLTLHKNNAVSVRDNGRGIPVDMHHWELRFLEIIMTIVTQYRPYGYRVSGGLRGVGLTAVNATADECSVEVARDGFLWRQEYRRGVRQTDVLQLRELHEGESTGTTITFRPDFTVFEPNEFDYATIAERCRELSYLMPGLTITLRDERGDEKEDVFYFPDGLVEYVAYLNRERQVMHNPVSAHSEWTIRQGDRDAYTVIVDVALQYADTMETTVTGYVNMVRTSGGYHTAIVPMAIMETLNDRTDKPNFSEQDVRPGLTAVVSVKHPTPSFKSQGDIHLMNVDVSVAAADAIHRAISHGMSKEGTYGQIMQKCLANRQASGQT